MKVPCSPETFYRLSLAEQGFLAPREDEVVTKIAENRKCDVAVVKMAQAVFEQMQKDGVPYESVELMTADSFKMAEAYHQHMADCAKEAEDLAKKLTDKLAAAAAEFAKEAGVEEFPPLLLVKVAGLQAQERVDEEAEKQAELEEVAAALKIAGTGDVAAAQGQEMAYPKFNLDDFKAHGTPALDTNKLTGHLLTALHGKPADASSGELPNRVAALHAALGVKPGQDVSPLIEHIGTTLHGQETSPTNLQNAILSARQMNTGVRGFYNRNKLPVAGGVAAAGLASAALLHHLHKKQKAEEEIKNLEAMVAQKRQGG